MIAVIAVFSGKCRVKTKDITLIAYNTNIFKQPTKGTKRE